MKTKEKALLDFFEKYVAEGWPMTPAALLESMTAEQAAQLLIHFYGKSKQKFGKIEAEEAEYEMEATPGPLPGNGRPRRAARHARKAAREDGKGRGVGADGRLAPGILPGVPEPAAATDGAETNR